LRPSSSNVEAGSEVNLKSGNLYQSYDEGILTLSYNSGDAYAYPGPLGSKWTHNYNMRIYPGSDNSFVTLRMGDGNRINFRLSGANLYKPDAISGDTSQIVKNANNTYTQTLQNGYVYGYNASGYLTSITDRNGNATTLTYNGTNLSSITDRDGRTTTIAMTGEKITGITDPMGRTHALVYNANGMLASVADPLSNTWQYTYHTDGSGRMVTKTDPAGRATTYAYLAGRLQTVTDPNSKTRTMNYVQSGITTITEKDGGVWTYKYDPAFTVKTEMTDPLGSVTRYRYDLKRNLTKVIAPDGSVTAYSYDANGNVTAVTNPLGKTTGYTYNSLNLVTSMTDPNTNQTQFSYDAKGNLTSITLPAGGVTSYVYDGKGNLTRITDARNNVTILHYDQQNNLTTIDRPMLNNIFMAYDAVGNMLTQTDALNHTTNFEYNSLNQLTKVTDPLGNETNFTYDYAGNRLTATDAKGKTTQYAYNYRGQPTQITDALNKITQLTYGVGCEGCGGAEKLSSLTDALYNETVYEYDLAGRLTSRYAPSISMPTFYEYDSKGNLISRRDRNNSRIIYFYDLNNRLIHKFIPGSPGVGVYFQYDDAGNMTYAGNDEMNYTYAYNADNRINQVTDQNNRTIQYQYDAAGNITSIAYPGNKTVSYTYDALNRLQTVKINWLNKTTTYNYDPAGRLTTLVNFNGTRTNYGYDDANRLISLENKTSSGGAIATYNYILDGNGNREHVYMNQPIGAIWTDENTVYAYDPSRIRLISDGTNFFSYDMEGQLISGYGSNFTFDYEHRLTGIGSNYAFVYNAIGHRLQATRTGVITKYIYDAAGNLIAEANANNVITKYYIYGIGLLAMVTNTGQVYTYHYNGTGSTVVMTSSSQGIVNRYAYDAFGNITNQQEPVPQPFKYVGQYGVMTEPNGFLYMRARYYDPKVGRFISEDPIGFAGGDVNLYAYVQNNPITRIDPLGLWGLGLNAGGTAEAGMGSGGAIQANSGVGLFGGGNNGINVGGYTASGSFAGEARSNQFVIGATAGLGVGGFISNAKSAQQLLGPFDTWTLNLPIVSFQYASDGSIWTAGMSLGKSWGISFSRYPVTTTTACGR